MSKGDGSFHKTRTCFCMKKDEPLWLALLPKQSLEVKGLYWKRLRCENVKLFSKRTQPNWTKFGIRHDFVFGIQVKGHVLDKGEILRNSEKSSTEPLLANFTRLYT